jgi:hypothetical protein
MKHTFTLFTALLLAPLAALHGDAHGVEEQPIRHARDGTNHEEFTELLKQTHQQLVKKRIRERLVGRLLCGAVEAQCLARRLCKGLRLYTIIAGLTRGMPLDKMTGDC